MVIQCILCILAIYGVINIFMSIFFRYMYSDVHVFIRIDKSESIEYVIRSLVHKLWFFKNITYIYNDEKENDKIIENLEIDYGVRII